MSILNKKEALESSLFRLSQDEPFYGGLLQELNIIFTELCPTAAIAYNKKKDCIELHLNSEYFCNMPIGERKAVLQHEILHFTNQHIWRYLAKKQNDNDRMLFNIAADMAINQYIKGLPKDCINVNNFKLKDGNPFPKFQKIEVYWDLLNEHDNEEKRKQADDKGQKTPNQYEIEKYLGKPFDEHNWEELSDDEKQKLLEEAKKVIKRTIEKSQFSYSITPDSVKDLLEEIENQICGINYKQILKSIIKKTISAQDRDLTWKRPSKRYGEYSKGTITGKVPNILFLVDSSGSISYSELCEFFNVVDGFLKVGQKQCKVGFWHTQLYKVKKYRNFTDIKQQDIEAGGTDPVPALEYAKFKNYDLTVILTDGYFDKTKNFKFENMVLWCISKTGNKNHPYNDLGRTIQIK